MADSKITALTAISTVDPTADPLVIVDVSDTSMAASGTTKKSTINQLLGAGGTATLASATITGDLTVDTNVLKVDTTNNVVGVGTASPNDWGAKFVSLRSTTGISYTGVWNDGVNSPRLEIGHTSTGSYLNASSASGGAYSRLRFQVAGADQYQVDAGGVFTWYDGAGGTRMTLNSTGLGVGGSPAFKLDVAGAANSAPITLLRLNNTGTTGGGPGIAARLQFNAGATALGFVQGSNFASGSIGVQISGDGTNIHQTIDSSGNVGIGVTPSAWGRGKGLEVGSIGNAFWGDSSSNGILSISANAYLTTSDLITGWKYATTNPAGRYQISETTHSWYTAASGTAGSAITFTQAMTLDASGRLGVGAVPASNVRAHFKGSSNSTDFSIYCVNSSDKLTFSVRNDGLFITGSLTDVATLPSSPYNLTTGSAANVHVDSQGIFYRSTSSIKYKTDVTDSVRGLADVLKLRPVTYKAKNSGNTVFGGLIAEEVAAAGLTEFVEYSPDNTPDAIHYGNMVSLLVAAIKELSAEVNALKKA